MGIEPCLSCGGELYDSVVLVGNVALCPHCGAGVGQTSIYTNKNLEVVLRATRGSMEGNPADFLVIDIYDTGELYDSLAISGVSEEQPQGIFIVQQARHRTGHIVPRRKE